MREKKRAVFAVERPANEAERADGHKVTLVDIQDTPGEAASAAARLGPDHYVVPIMVPDRRGDERAG